MSKKTETKKELVLADDVWNRVVQIIQEGMLMGIDVTDLLRQIRVEPGDPNTNLLVLTASYRKQVKEGHERMLAEAERLRAEREKNPLAGRNLKLGIIKDDDDSGPN